MKAVIRYLTLISAMFALTACGGAGSGGVDASAGGVNASAALPVGNVQGSSVNSSVCDAASSLFTATVKTQMNACYGCHIDGGLAGGSALRLIPTDDSLTLTNIDDYANTFGNQLILNKSIGIPSHGGGAVFTNSSSQAYNDLASMLQSLDVCRAAGSGSTGSNSTGSNSAGSSSTGSSGNSLPSSEGGVLYQQQCVFCHGADGNGTTPITAALNRPDLVAYIAANMPYGAAVGCGLDCANSITTWMQANFNSNTNGSATLDGGVIYAQQCAACHGGDGNGITPVTAALNRPDLVNFITTSMPNGSPQNCNAACAQAVASWMKINLQVVAVIRGNPEALYAQQCLSCHGADGNGLTPITGSLNRSDMVSYLLNTMPYGSPARCDASCANELTTWMLATFTPTGNGAVINPPTVNIGKTLSTVSNNKAKSLLFRSSLNLLGRVPNEQELAQVETNGSSSLASIIDAQLDDDAFIERTKDIFNDLLLTQEWDSTNGFYSYMRNYSWNSFANGDSEWIEADNSIPYYNTIRRYISNGHSRSPLELIGYIVKNNYPFSEILTANYAMLNWYSAKSFGLENMATFRDLPLAEQKNTDFPKDPNDFQPVFLPNVPSAGVLTTGVYMFKYRTTATNRNRHRAFTLLKTFLDTDVLAIDGDRPGDSESSFTYPTLEDPKCVACHLVMDPVASAYKHWISFGGQGRPFYNPAPGNNEWDSNYILAAGFNGEIAPSNTNPLPWVAKKITEDPRFARAMVKAVFSSFTGVQLIPATLDGVSFQSTPYLQQQAFIAAIAEQFIADNFDFKSMVKNLVLSDYTLGQHDSQLSDLMITPLQLNKKIQSTLGQPWDNWLDTWNILYGGINSSSVVLRNQIPNGTTVTIQLRMAEDMACKITAKEFSIAPAARLLLGNIEPDVLADSAQNITRIKQTIVEIYARLIGKRLALNDAIITLAYDVYSESLTLGQAGIADGSVAKKIANNCRVSASVAQFNQAYVDTDDNYYTRAWQAVIQFVLMDPRYFYL